MQQSHQISIKLKLKLKGGSLLHSHFLLSFTLARLPLGLRPAFYWNACSGLFSSCVHVPGYRAACCGIGSECRGHARHTNVKLSVGACGTVHKCDNFRGIVEHAFGAKGPLYFWCSYCAFALIHGPSLAPSGAFMRECVGL